MSVVDGIGGVVFGRLVVVGWRGRRTFLVLLREEYRVGLYFEVFECRALVFRMLLRMCESEFDALLDSLVAASKLDRDRHPLQPQSKMRNLYLAAVCKLVVIE